MTKTNRTPSSVASDDPFALDGRLGPRLGWWTRLRHRGIAFGFAVGCLLVRARKALRRSGQPRLRGIDHVTLAVHDLDVARRFYCDVLGAAHLMTVDDAALVRFGRSPAPDGGEGVHHISVLVGGQTRVDLFQQRDGQPSLLR